MDSEIKNDYLQIGGRYAISWRTAILFFPIFVIGIPFLESNLNKPDEFFLWLFASFMSVLPCIAIFYIAERTYFKDRIESPKPAFAVIFLGAIIGAVKGGVLEWIALTVNLHSGNFSEQLALRTFNSAVLGAAFMPFLSFVQVFNERYQLQRRNLVEQLTFIDLKKTHEKEIADLIGEQSLEKITANLHSLLDNAKATFQRITTDQSSDPKALAKVLTSAAEDIVRPLSHTLYREGHRKIEVLTTSKTLKYMSAHFTFEPRIILLLYVITSMKNLFVLLGLQLGLQILTINVVILFFLLMLGKAALARARNGSSSLFLSLSIVITLTYLFADGLVKNLFAIERDYGKIAIEGIWIEFLIVLAAIFRSAAKATDHRLEEMRKEIGADEITTHRRSLSDRRNYKQYSKFLHGVLHSRLTASAQAISNASNLGDTALLDAEISRAKEILNLDFDFDVTAKPQALLTEIAHLRHKWEGILEITFQNTAGALTLYEEAGILQVINEALSNAFRHGRATSVWLTMEINGAGEIELTALDNGVGVISQTPGLGSSYYTEVAGSNWKLTSLPSGQGSQLKMKIQRSESL